MSIDRSGAPFIGNAAILALIAALAGFGLLAVPFGLLTIFFIYFFRDPDRHSDVGPDEILSPADGRVLVAGDSEPSGAPPGTWRQISIFLSPLDVHVNRIPLSGRITRVVYTPGKFFPAYRAEAASQNERNEIW